MRSFVRPWRRLPFTVRFAGILAFTGVLIAVTAGILAANDANVAAENQASYGLSVARSLLGDQRTTGGRYAEVVAAAVNRSAGGTADMPRVLAVESQGSPQGVVGVTGPAASMYFTDGRALPAADPRVHTIEAAVVAGIDLAAVDGGPPWWLSTAEVSPGLKVVAAQPLINDIPATMLVRNRVVVSGGTVASLTYRAGQRAPAEATPDHVSVAQIGGMRVAFAGSALGAGYTLVAMSAVTDSVGTEGGFVFIAVLLVAITMIILLVRSDLQRPLRRLDRAVGAISSGDFSTPVPHSHNDDEISRLAQSFEQMRAELKQTLDQSAARASIAAELNAQQPLQRALTNVCNTLRDVSGADSVFICVAASEMTDEFVAGVGWDEFPDAQEILNPHSRLGMLMKAGTIQPVALEFNGAPAIAVLMQQGTHRLGVLVAVFDANISPDHEFDNLLAAAAGQAALALERYRFIVLVQQQAAMDDLTGLHNHRFLVDHIAQQVALAERLNSPLAILMIDLDHFKRINDTYGHPAGDTALTSFATTLRSNIRRSDLAARYGGEEFVVVMPGATEADARMVAEKIRSEVSRDPVQLDGRGTRETITVSIGVAAYPENTTTPRELLRLADEAVYAAKSAGRNRVVASESIAAPVTAAGRQRKRTVSRD